MSDLISRQAAIDVINAVFPVNPMKSEYAQGIACGAALAKTYVEQLPSAQLEPCEDAVSRKAVYDAMVEKGQRSRRYKLGEILELNGTEIREALDTVPSAQPGRKRGKWQEDPSGYGFWICSNCGFVSEASAADVLYNFCPYCGADMREVDDGSD